MLHLITGDGKGKTSAAVGMAARAAGHGIPVLFVQFLKDDSSGEIAALRKIGGVEVLHSPVSYGFTFQMTPQQLAATADACDALLEQAMKSEAGLIVLDEVLHALQSGLVSRERLQQLLDLRLDCCKTENARADMKDCCGEERSGREDAFSEIVLSGAAAPSWLMEQADYISEVRKIRHPYDSGVTARRGVEY